MKYYVYELIDPRSDAIFYVGKGKGKRANDHVRQAKSGFESEKCNLIREILAENLTVKVNIVSRFKCEFAAYAFEAQHIEFLGLENLTNIAFGGRGGVSDALLENDKGQIALLIVLEKTVRQYGIDAGVWLDGKCIISLRERLSCSKQKIQEIFDRRGADWTRKQFSLRNAELVVT